VIVVGDSSLIGIEVVVMSDKGLAGGDIDGLSLSGLESRNLRIECAGCLNFHGKTS
jgi:hypothetical protein